MKRIFKGATEQSYSVNFAISSPVAGLRLQELFYTVVRVMFALVFRLTKDESNFLPWKWSDALWMVEILFYENSIPLFSP
jgi:hypothetical protein